MWTPQIVGTGCKKALVVTSLIISPIAAVTDEPYSKIVFAIALGLTSAAHFLGEKLPVIEPKACDAVETT